MTITNPNAALADTSSWVHACFMVSLSEQYETPQAALQAALTDETFGTVAAPALGANMKNLLSNLATSDTQSGLSPAYYARRKCRDTSLGGNDAINPYWQYCENDDIMHPFHSTMISGSIGMGRVYSETIDDQQKILYLGFGTPVFNNLAGFYSKAYDSNLGQLMNNGPEGLDIANIIGQLCGYAAAAIVNIPRIPLVLAQFFLSGTSKIPITKYYDFKSQMPLYYRCVNSILIQLGVNLGIVESTDAPITGTTGSATTSTTHTELTQTINAELGNQQGMPDYVQQYNFDIFKIMLKRALYEKTETNIQQYSTDQGLAAQAASSTTDTTTTDTTSAASATATASTATADGTSTTNFVKSYINAFTAAFSSAAHQACMFIGFRIERGMSSSESLSTSTGQSPVQQTLNSNLQGARNAQFSFMKGNVDSGMIQGVIDAVKGTVGDFTSGLAQGFGMSGLSALITGAAMVDIPEVWQDSSFSKSYSFNLQLRSPYGDPFSIMQSIYVPLACVLAGALPRATGASSYTSPFLCQAYCKGMFSVPLGIIDSVSINRGADTHGWNAEGLPLAVDLSISIKDLSPSMIVALAGDSTLDAIKDLVGANTPFNQYLMTLSGMGPLEWINPVASFERRAAVLKSVLMEDKLSPEYLGMRFGSTMLPRFIYNFSPTTSLLPK